jgi:hypothetical protein
MVLAGKQYQQEKEKMVPAVEWYQQLMFSEFLNGTSSCKMFAVVEFVGE